MKVSLSWLKELVDIPCGVNEIAESLSMSGFEVEELVDLEDLIEGIVVGLVEEVSPHPNADKLRVCKVNVGETNQLQIVCGAPNVREGIHVLVALEGSYLKAIDLKIKVSELRGVLSQGMICSLTEIGINSQAQGIAILEEMISKMPPLGSSPAEALGLNDIILDLSITANRPDGMSMIGIAREVSALKQTKLNLPKISKEQSISLFDPVKKSPEILSFSGNFSLRRIENVRGEQKSTKWINDRLNNIQLKPINAIVDIANYVMIEQGQPLHAYDADLIDSLIGRRATINDFGFRKAKEGEKFLGIDEKSYILSNKCSVITCADKIIAIAGILGSKDCAVNTDTKSIWLEAALFKPEAVRITSREIGVRTESSSRYEKGISPEQTIPAAQRAIDLLLSQFDCKVDNNWAINDTHYNSKAILLNRKKVHNILGRVLTPVTDNKSEDTDINDTVDYIKNDLTDFEITDALTRLGCSLLPVKEGWEVIVPTIRCNDLNREIDLIEEVARIVGYERFDSSLPNPIKPGGLTDRQKTERSLRQLFTSSGLQEITTMSLVATDKVLKNRISLANPLLSETSCLRNNLWEEHISICKRNINAGQTGCWIFEIGSIYLQEKEQIREQKLISGAITGNRTFGKWQESTKKDSIDYYEARGLLDSVFKSLNLSVSDQELNEDPLFHPGKASKLILEGKLLGKFGQFHPTLSEKFGLSKSIYLFEIDLELMLIATNRKGRLVTKYKPFPTVPTMERDISLLIDKNIRCADLINIIRKAGKPYLEKVELIDRYEGKGLTEGKISQAFRIIYRSKKNTLTEQEIEPIQENIMKQLKSKFDIELRSS